jgi:MoaA/NifB/PqqE/SkfB family radical SAM enzyme
VVNFTIIATGHEGLAIAQIIPTSVQDPARRSDGNPLTRRVDEISIELTLRCNLTCAMCAVWEGRRDGLPGDRVADLLGQARGLGAQGFTPSGAETLMRRDALDLLEEAARLGFTRMEVVTNGALVPRHARRLARIPGLHLNISLDGPPAVHDALRGAGSHADAMAGLQAAQDAGIPVGLSAVLMRPTLATLGHILDVTIARGLPGLSIQPFQPEIAGKGRDHRAFTFDPGARAAVAQALHDIAARAAASGVAIHTGPALDAFVPYLFDGVRPVPPGGCHMPTRFLLVNAQGDTFPCFFLRRQSMGNVADGRLTLAEVWASAERLRLQLLGLSGRCGGCLAACSDIATYAGVSSPAHA